MSLPTPPPKFAKKMFITNWIIELFVEPKHKEVLLVLVKIINTIEFGFLYDMKNFADWGSCLICILWCTFFHIIWIKQLLLIVFILTFAHSLAVSGYEGISIPVLFFKQHFLSVSSSIFAILAIFFRQYSGFLSFYNKWNFLPFSSALLALEKLSHCAAICHFFC